MTYLYGLHIILIFFLLLRLGILRGPERSVRPADEKPLFHTPPADCLQRQQQEVLSPSGDTATPEGLAEEAKAKRDYKGGALISFILGLACGLIRLLVI